MSSAKLAELERHKSAIGNLVPFLDTIRSIAEIGFRRAERSLEPLERFKERLDDALRVLGSAPGSESWWPALTRAADDKPVGVLVIGTQRGLCGAFNQRLVADALAYAASLTGDGKDVHLMCLGERCQRLLASQGVAPLYAHSTSSLAEPHYETIEEITLDLIGLIEDGEIGQIVVIHNVPYQRFQYRPETTPLFPIEIPESVPGPAADVRPPEDAEALFVHLVTEQMLIDLYEMVLRSTVSEQLARVSAMQMASENAERVLGRLRLDINRAHSEEITGSLLEIVSGYEAVSNFTHGQRI